MGLESLELTHDTRANGGNGSFGPGPGPIGRPPAYLRYSEVCTKIQNRINMLWEEVDGINTSEQDKYAALRVQSELQDLLISIQQSLLEDNGII